MRLSLWQGIIWQMRKIKIAFDLDGVIIDKPPIIPKSLLERLFRGNCEEKLHYRFPKSKLEQKIRKLSHFYLFRPPIKQNIELIKEISRNSDYEIYFVSGRYSFLKEETHLWLEKRNLKNVAKDIFLNLNDEQPHFFKEKILKEIMADVFVDDDNLLADYLSEKLPKVKVFCYSAIKHVVCQKAKKINSLRELLAEKV